MSCSHAEFIQQLFKDQYRSCRAEDDEGLTAEQAEDCAGQSRAQKAFHHTLKINETHSKMTGHADTDKVGKKNIKEHKDLFKEILNTFSNFKCIFNTFKESYI